MHVLSKISYVDLDIFDVEWRLTIIPGSIIAGSGAVGSPPAYCPQKKFAVTWKSQSYKVEVIGCAAFAVNYAMNNSIQSYSGNPKKACKDALAMQKQLEWGLETTLKQLDSFKDAYPTWRLAVIVAGTPKAAHIVTGDRFVFKDKENLVYIVYDFEKKHFGAITSPLELYKAYHRDDNILFCHYCVEMFRPSKNHICHANEYIKPEKVPCECGRYGSHTCGMTVCKNCQQLRKLGTSGNYESHRCIVMQQEPKKYFRTDVKDVKGYDLYAYDIESLFENVPSASVEISEFEGVDDKFTGDIAETCVFLRRHQPILVCFENIYLGKKGHFYGENCLEEFLLYVRNQNGGKNVILAHNASGYDTRLLLRDACKLGHEARLELILRGSKFMQLKIGKTSFNDSLLHLKGSLACLNKDFGESEMEKGFFPHLFNTRKNENYIGVIPGQEYFDLAFTMKDESSLRKFKEWHVNQVALGPIWNFKEQLVKYGVNDVSVLSRIMVGYDEAATRLAGFSPWFNVTAPLFCAPGHDCPND
jgi:DNA polymerase type B, organellar and viral